MSHFRFISRVRMGLSMLVLALVAACASAPVQEMSDARQAVEAAVQAGAAQRAPAETKAAQAALADAERALKYHAFSKARISAQEARSKAIEAQRIAQSPSTTVP